MNPAFPPRELIHFLHDCFLEDHRSQAVLDVYASKVEQRFIFSGRANLLLKGSLSAQAGVKIESLSKTAAMHQTEKDLSLGVLLAIGCLKTEDAEQRICAPLVSFPLQLVPSPKPSPVQSGEWLWAFDRDRPRLNHALFSLWTQHFDLEPGVVESALEPWLAKSTTIRSFQALARRLARVLPDVDLTSLKRFPDLIGTSEIHALRRKSTASTQIQIVPAMTAMLIRRSLETRGVLSELERLAEEDDSSTPLLTLFDQLKPIKGQPVGRPHNFKPDNLSLALQTVSAPALLSDAQKRIALNAAQFPLSLVIGPPGTGKSFTIAAVALDALARGDSVLIASRSHHAVDVIGDKLEDLLGQKDFVVRGGRKAYQKELRDRVIDWLSGKLPGKATSEPALEKTQNMLQGLLADIRDLEGRLSERSDLEQLWGRLSVLGPQEPRLMSRWGARFQTWKLKKELAALPAPYWQEMEQYKELLEQRMELQAELIRQAIRFRLHRTLRTERRQLTRFRDAVRARTGQRREALFESIDLNVLLLALPVWLVNLADAASILPLRREMFDLVILDESTQCDIASSIPVLQRAKRAVVVGDPKQLRHLSFLSRDRQERLAERYDLGIEAATRFNYRDKSILDVVDDTLQDQDQVVLLDEHFRSAPSIIAFSNREIYGERLRIMQEHPAHDYHRALYLRQVSGRRGEDGANEAEAEALVQEVLERIEADSDKPGGLARSIGVLSPFRGQVDLLSRRLSERLPSSRLQRHQLKVGTAYAFQGEERDLMFLSLALDPEAHASAFRYLERPDVFNVAVTRARSEQIVYTSLPDDWVGSGPTSLVRRFLEHMRMDVRPTQSDHPLDPFLEEIKTELKLRKYRTWPAYPVAGMEVDLVVEHLGRCLGIDLVGHPGAYAGSFELERYRMFNRAGLPLMPLPYFAWRHARGTCLEAIQRHLEGAPQ